MVLSILCAVFLGAFLWQLSKDNTQQPVQQTATITNRNAIEQKIQDSINQSSLLLLSDSVYGNRIMLTDTLMIANDSIHINGNGIVLTGDSLFKGPALLIAPDCKYIILENIVFENLSKAIVTESRNLQLKNVRFNNCAVSIQHGFMFRENKMITGSITDTSFFQNDSLPK